MNEKKEDVVFIVLLDCASIDRDTSMALRKKVNKSSVGSTVEDETLKVKTGYS